MADEHVNIYDQAASFFRNYYTDRGMVKWQGYYLSDHTENVQKTNLAETVAREQVRMPEMSLADITQLLFLAYDKKQTVRIQTANKNDQNIIPPIISGLVGGYTDTDVIIGQSHIPLEDLWWAEIVTI